MIKKRGFLHELNKNKILFLMILPTLLFFLINSYTPMIGLYYAFTSFDFDGGLLNSPFIGMDNFKFLWQSGILIKLIRNTIGYNLAFIILGNAAAIFCAVLLSEIKGRKFVKITQSVMFLPYFISFVLVNAIAYNLFNYEKGFLNTTLEMFNSNPVDVYSSSNTWIFLLIAFYIWKNLGYSMVIYLAAITGISDEYFEAAKIDGANIYQRIWYITIPMLKPTFFILFLFALGTIMKGQFDLFYQLIGNNGMLFDATDIIDTYVYRSLRVSLDIGMATAAGLFQSVFGFALIITVNYFIKKSNDEYALF